MIELGSEEWKALVMRCDPFAGDWGYTVKNMSDKIVKTRKPCECMNCGKQTVPGTLARKITDIADGEMHAAAFCQDCCDAMAASVVMEDNGADRDYFPFNDRASGIMDPVDWSKTIPVDDEEDYDGEDGEEDEPVEGGGK